MIRIRLFVGSALTAALSGFRMMAYIANSSYVLQEQLGLHPIPFALFFAVTALAQVLWVVQAIAMALSAPLASSGGARTAVPMIWVLLVGVAGSVFCHLVVARPAVNRSAEPAPTH